MGETLAKGITLYPGDCMDVLETLAENSIDSCVTDPPYHLTSIVKRFGGENSAPCKVSEFYNQHGESKGSSPYIRSSAGFMGKKWDGGDIAFRPETWAAVYRVLKPGAHLLAFGGTRTYHRMACAIEDAGFEVRDCLSWNFGSGFPKSHNISKKLDDTEERCSCSKDLRDLRDNLDSEEQVSGSTEQDVLAEMQRCADISSEPREDKSAEDTVCSMRQADLSGAECSKKERGSILQRVVSEQDICDAPSEIRGERIGEEMSGQGSRRQPQSSLEGRSHVPQTPRELCLGQVREMPAGADVDGSSRRVRDGASTCDGEMDRTPVDARGMCASSGSQAAEQCAGESGIVAVQSQPQECGAWPRCRRCGKPIVPEGIGTALKPAMELITLARKPLSERTVAANVLKWGTGAINVDGCRVEHVTVADGNLALNPHLRDSINGGNGGQIFPTEAERRVVKPHAAGRWPANVIHDGSEGVVGAFPNAPGQQRDIDPFAPSSKTGNIYGKMNREGEASANRRYPAQRRNDAGSAARFFYTAKADQDDRLGSKHPTVKPLDLMQYLCRLVTPPGGLILDPFAGTGTTAEAALREGFRCVLIEREAEYQEDIRRRMRLAMSGPDERKRDSIKERLKGKPMDAGPLFGGAA